MSSRLSRRTPRWCRSGWWTSLCGTGRATRTRSTRGSARPTRSSSGTSPTSRFTNSRAAAGPTSPSKHRRLDERQNDQYRLIVLFLAYTGVRFGEMAALRVGRIDFLRRRAMVAESVTLVGSNQVWGTPKVKKARGTDSAVPRGPACLARARQGTRRSCDRRRARGGGLREPIFRRAAFDRAAEAIGKPGLHPHELRHTAASLAIAAGADVKVAQKMLGRPGTGSPAYQTQVRDDDNLISTATSSTTVSTTSPTASMPQQTAMLHRTVSRKTACGRFQLDVQEPSIARSGLAHRRARMTDMRALRRPPSRTPCCSAIDTVVERNELLVWLINELPRAA